MKTFNKVSLSVLVVALMLGLSGLARAATTAVDLGTAKNFAVLGGSAINDTTPSVISGNVGLSPAGWGGSALTCAEVTGTIYSVDGSGPLPCRVTNAGVLTPAKNDLTTAYTDAANRTPFTTLSSGDNQLGGQTLTAGVYRFGGASTANLIGTLRLDAQGDSNAVFIFQATSTLVTASSSVVRLINGAQACNVFWQVSSSATLGTSTTFVGTVMADQAIVDTGSSTVEGRLLARITAVTLNDTTITKPVCVVTQPTMPNTGVVPDAKSSTPWNIIIPAGIFAALFSFYLARKRRII